MSKDPYFDREVQKYGSPIASREYLLALFAKHDTPLTRDELIEALDLTTDEQKEALRRRLRAMERDGQLVFTRQKRYVLPERLDMIHGTVLSHRDGYGFLRVEGRKDDLFISPEQMKRVLHGDEVLAQSLAMDNRGRQEARIVRLLSPINKQIVGRYFTEAGVGFVVPDDSRYNFDILIPEGKNLDAKMGSVVVVELTQRATRHTKALGHIIEVLGEQMGTSLAIDIAVRTYDVPYTWPDEVLKEADHFGSEVPASAKAGRVDLRHLPLVTIDGEDARDFDDAVYCEPKRGGGWRLWVAIADVSYYVRPGSAIDQEAYKRGTSVYFPGKVIPMLPEVLSNGLCSLNPQVDRLCLVCEMTLSAQGRLSGYRFYEAVMNSHARLTYNKVWQILQGSSELRERYYTIAPHLFHLYDMYHALDAARTTRGGIAFESQEPRFIFNAAQRIERIEMAERNDAHKIIEECMILANISAARMTEKAEQASLYRVHDKPTSENLVSLRSALNELGLTLSGSKEPTPKNYADLMIAISDRPDRTMLQTLLLRSMKQAIYDPDNRGHFGLALTAYSHFTSPIRRYPDLLVHRTIKYLLAQTDPAKVIAQTATGGQHYTLAEMLQFGQHCSMTERRADDATRDVIDWLKCDYMKDHIGESFSGTISSVTGFGFFVQLDELFIDGLVHISSLVNDYYRFDNIGQRLIGESTGQIYRLGDKVVIRVAAVNMDDRNIDFILVSSTRGVKRSGKTERTRKSRTKTAKSNRAIPQRSRVSSHSEETKRGKSTRVGQIKRKAKTTKNELNSSNIAAKHRNASSNKNDTHTVIDTVSITPEKNRGRVFNKHKGKPISEVTSRSNKNSVTSLDHNKVVNNDVTKRTRRRKKRSTKTSQKGAS